MFGQPSLNEGGWFLFTTNQITKSMRTSLFDPIINGVPHVTYHREPTRGEIKFGEGATHYRDFPLEQVVNRKKSTTNGVLKLKRWLVADDGLRYYR